MRNKFLLIPLLFILLIGACSCSRQSNPDLQSVSKDVELFTVAKNISLKTGINIDNDTVLESVDFIGFNYKYNESQKEYIFTFKLTSEGQKKMTDVSTKLAETSGDLSLWIGDELISSPKVTEPITGDAFAVIIVEVTEDNISDFVDKFKD